MKYYKNKEEACRRMSEAAKGREHPKGYHFTQRKYTEYTSNPYLLLIEAIVQLAYEDYVASLRSGPRKAGKAGGTAWAENSLEAWFRSAWGEALSFGNGELLIKSAKKEARKPTNDIKRGRYI